MFPNSNFSDRSIEIYKKIFCRHLKELGIYSIITKEYFNKNHITFQSHIKKINGQYGSLSGVINTLWSPIHNTLKDCIKASLFLLSVISDEKFMNVFLNEPGFNKHKYNDLVSHSAKVELNYLFNLDEIYWKNIISKSDAMRIKYFADLCNYRLTYSNNEKLKNILNYGK